jgi:mRNA interferase RelE/StbE
LAYVVDFTDTAERELKRLSLPARVGVARVLERLAANPRRPGVRMVVGQDHLYRDKAGDYRIIFAIHERRVVVVVVRVVHRTRVYRHMDSLPPGWD